MSPQQKRWNDMFMSITTMALLALLALIVVVFLLSEIRLNNLNPFASKPIEVERGRLLTTEEVANERLLLPTRPNQPKLETTPVATNSTSNNRTRPLTEAETADLIKRYSTPATSEIYKPPLDSSRTESVLESNGQAVASIVTHTAPGAGVNIQNIALNTEEETAVLSLEGTIFALRDSRITITGPGYNVIDVKYSPATRFLINGKPMSPTDLMVGDVIVTEGQGSITSSELEAFVVVLVGRIDIFTSI